MAYNLLEDFTAVAKLREFYRSSLFPSIFPTGLWPSSSTKRRRIPASGWSGLPANFERNLERIEKFLIQMEAPTAYDSLLEEWLDKLLPNLERFPEMGARLLERQARAIESVTAQEALRKKAGDTSIRQYVLAHYLVLYAVTVEPVYLLSIRHHRQLSFDLDAIWLAEAQARSPDKG